MYLFSLPRSGNTREEHELLPRKREKKNGGMRQTALLAGANDEAEMEQRD